ncbi:hypothetical protein EG028_11445 [Chitinophaga barathri]|uniref:Uncharacterized protein n=1 Tax=Chitinophaga barathri TaxID=1647451 RepID=A0A3N4MBN9_9BACT|nr:hypothetical protein EG028_11445 [Chitinophaga barathri]
MFEIDSVSLNIECPTCDFGIEIELIDVRLERTIICHNCKENIKLIDDSGSAHNAARDIQKGLDNLFKMFK